MATQDPAKLQVEIEERAATTKKFGRRQEGPDYLKVAAEQRDTSKRGGAIPRIKSDLDFQFEVSADRIRRIGLLLHNSSQLPGEFTGTEAVAFLTLYHEQLQAKLGETLRNFIKDKLTK